MLRHIVIFCILLIGIIRTGAEARSAVPAPVSNAVPDAVLVSTARYSYLFWDIYDARLYAPNGVWQPDNAFALSLTYLRALDGADITERSIKEMRAQGLSNKTQINAWREAMKSVFPDVREQDTIIGLQTGSGSTQFYLNNALLGEVSDPAFGKWFFNIWLGPDTTEPEFRAKLLRLENAQ